MTLCKGFVLGLYMEEIRLKWRGNTSIFSMKFIYFCLNDSMIETRGGGLGKPIDRDQRSWVLLSNPKILCHCQKTLKILSENYNPIKYPPKTRFKNEA